MATLKTRLAAVAGVVIGLVTLQRLRKRNEQSEPEAEIESASEHAEAAVEHARAAASKAAENTREKAEPRLPVDEGKLRR